MRIDSDRDGPSSTVAGRRGWWLAIVTAAALLVGVTGCTDDSTSSSDTTAAVEDAEMDDPTPTSSQVRSVTVAASVDAGSFGGVAYERLTGQVAGVVDPAEPVVGLDELALDAEGLYPYTAAFEVVRPVDATAETVVVEAENRGAALLPLLFEEGFLFEGGRAYARVAWQTEINPTVPPTAQGVGEVIVRDFGRVLRAGEIDGAVSPLGGYGHLVLGGWSQGAWFVTTLVAQGFNVDPSSGDGVFDGAVAVSGAGNVLAINESGDDGAPQTPYIRPDAAPSTAEEILTRPRSDPTFVDIANYTDFYRLRAGLSAGGDTDGYWRYDWPSPHAPGAIVPASIVFDSFGCNDGRAVPLNPIDFRPQLRAVLVGLELELGAPVVDAQRPASGDGLPDSVEFDLTDEQPAGTGELNPLPGVTTPVPAVDGDLAPEGGIRFAAVAAPLGSPAPVGLPPVTTASITEVCGNFGGWQPRDAAEVRSQWPTGDDYLATFTDALDELIAQGYVLPIDRSEVLSGAAEAYAAATSA